MTRRVSLAGRLSRALTACVALALAVMALSSTLIMRSWMLADVDSELHRLSQRADEHLDIDDADSEEDDGEASEAQSGEHGGADGAILPAGPGRRGPGNPGGPGFGGSGVADGTLQYVSEDGEAAGAIVTNFALRYLDDEALEVLESVPADALPHTVHLPGWGTFRVVSQVFDTRTILVGRQTDSVDNVVWMLVAVELVLSLCVALGAGLIGRAWVRRELRPLSVVREAAADIARRDLADDAQALTRVGDAAVSGPVEVAEVAGAFNAMIDAVEDGMERRARSETKLRQFVADASHELRTPLASVQGYAQLARRDIDEASRSQALERISSEGARMATLVEELLTLARLDDDRSLARDRVEVIPLVLDALSDAHVLCPDHTWELGSAAQEPVLGDEAAVRQILTNLLTNARVHTPAGTRVVVSVLGEDSPRLRSCPGVDETSGAAGARAPASSRTRDGHGSSGLGMSIVDSLARAMGGRVCLVDSESGTVIDVTLPSA